MLMRLEITCRLFLTRWWTSFRRASRSRTIGRELRRARLHALLELADSRADPAVTGCSPAL
jgi:hypothetical protein